MSEQAEAVGPQQRPDAPERGPGQTGVRDRLAGLTSKVVEVGAAVSYQAAVVIAMAIIFPITTRSLGTDGYGEYTTLYVIAGFALSLVYASGGAAIVQLVLQRQRTTDSVRRHGRIQVLVLALPFAAIGVLVSSAFFGSNIIVPAIIVFGSDLLVAGFADVNTSILFAVRGTSYVTKIRIILPILKAVGVVGLAVTDSVTILGLVIVNSLATVVLFIVSSVAMRRLRRELATTVDSVTAPADPDHTETTTRELAGLTGVYAASISANTVQDQGEKLVLAGFRPRAEVGEYAAAYRLVELVLLPLTALNVVATRWVLPKDSRRHIQVARAKRMSIPVAIYCVIGGIAIAVARPLTRLVIGDDFELALEMTVWLCGFPLVRALADVPTIGLLGLGRNTARMWLGVTGAGFATVCYLVLVPLFEWRGAVIGTYLSEVATLIGGWVLLVKYQAVADADADADDADDAHGEVDGMASTPIANVSAQIDRK